MDSPGDIIFGTIDMSGYNKSVAEKQELFAGIVFNLIKMLKSKVGHTPLKLPKFF